MVMGWIFTGMVLISILAALYTGQGTALSAAAMSGAADAVALILSMAGAICLWSGVGKLAGAVGITKLLSQLLMPLLRRVFPQSRVDEALAGDLSANITANLLGLGNAATPMGISAARRLKAPGSDVATDQLCRLVVLNTASIQLIPSNVAAVRSAMGCPTPFDILPCVWVTSVLSATAGVLVAVMLGRGSRAHA